jgi:hypothetical protein
MILIKFCKIPITQTQTYVNQKTLFVEGFFLLN